MNTMNTEPNQQPKPPQVTCASCGGPYSSFAHECKHTASKVDENERDRLTPEWRPLEPGEKPGIGDRKDIEGFAWETRRPRPAQEPESAAPLRIGAHAHCPRCDRYHPAGPCENFAPAAPSILGTPATSEAGEKAGGGAVCLHGIRHPWECKACADAAWEERQKAGGGDQQTCDNAEGVWYKCDLPQGHDGPHKAGKIEWRGDQQTAQTAREWLDAQSAQAGGASKEAEPWIGYAIQLADRADRAEAELRGADDEAKRWKASAIRAEAAFNAEVLAHRGTCDRCANLETERDALRTEIGAWRCTVEARTAERDAAIKTLRQLSKLGTGPCGGGGSLDQYSQGRMEAEEKVRKIARAALNQTNNTNEQ